MSQVMSQELKQLKLIDMYEDISDLSEVGFNRLLQIRVEPEMTLQNIISTGITYWLGDCSLPGSSEKQIRSLLTELLINKYGKNTSHCPFDKEGTLLIDLVEK